MNARWRAAVGFALLALTGSCTTGPTTFRTGQNAAAIMGGETDTTDNGVVGVVLLNGSGIAQCSGSLLMPNLVLTARHCVSMMSSEDFICQSFTDPMTHMAYTPTTAAAPFPISDFYITNDVEVQMDGDFVRAAQILVPPGSTGVPACGKDIALIVLASPIAGTLIVPRLDAAPIVGENYTAVGYGGTDGSGDNAGMRRVRSMLSVAAVGEEDEDGIEFVAPQEWMGNTGTCPGDSGGPALDSLGQVMGSVSRGDATTCDNPVYTGVEGWAAFIRMAAMTAATAAGTAPPDWATPPVPNSQPFGATCRGDTECMGELSCLIVGSARLCTTEDCSMCPDGWACGNSASGVEACLPVAPSPDAGAADTGTDDAGSPPADTGTVTPTDAGTSDGGTTGSMHGGCATQPGGTRDAGGTLASLFAALAIIASKRRGRRSSR